MLALAGIMMGSGIVAFALQTEIRDQAVVGGELRLIVESFKLSSGGLMSHSSKASDARGWLVVINLASPASNSLDRVRTYGPLWSVDDTRSELSASIGVDFTAADRAAHRATPFVGFGAHGEPVRLTYGADGKVASRSQLVFDRKSAHWEPLTPFRPVPTPKADVWHYTQIRTLSRAITVVLTEDQRGEVYETLSGERREDPWLWQTFQVIHGTDITHREVWLTDDLKFFVVFPEPGWVNRDGSQFPFHFDGQEQSRQKFGLYFDRDQVRARLFEKPHVQVDHSAYGPKMALSIDGRLYLHSWTEDMMYLDPVDGGASYRTPYPFAAEAVRTPATFIHSPVTGSLHILRKRDDAHPYDLDRFQIFSWSYRTGATSKLAYDIGELIPGRFLRGASCPVIRIK